MHALSLPSTVSFLAYDSGLLPSESSPELLRCGAVAKEHYWTEPRYQGDEQESQGILDCADSLVLQIVPGDEAPHGETYFAWPCCPACPDLEAERCDFGLIWSPKTT